MMKRNGKIELMRFFFSIGVLVFHLNRYFYNNHKYFFHGKVGMFTRGNIGVEFFFLVSGYLMAKSIASQLRREDRLPTADTLPDDTLRFLWGKVVGILPYHLPYCLVIILVRCWGKGLGTTAKFVASRFFSLLLLNRTGLMGQNGCFLGVEWYICSMLLAMAILYPLCKRYYKMMTHLVAPLMGILILGWMNYTYGHISGGSSWDGLTYHCNLRALAELGLGAASFEVVRVMEQKHFTLVQQTLLSLSELVCYGLVFCYSCSSMEGSYEVHAVFLLLVATTISFSQKGLFGQSKLFQNRLCIFLGGLSLPIFLFQQVAWLWVDAALPNAALRTKVLLSFFFTCIVSVVHYGGLTAYQNRKKQ